MDISTVKIMKKTFERNLKDMVDKFEIETGTIVEDIDILRIRQKTHSVTRTNHFIKIEVGVSIE